MKYITIDRTTDIFEKLCEYCDREIVEENLRINGGTLNYSGIVYDSDYLIVCVDNNIPVAFNSIVELEDNLYIYQIAVKNNRKKQGIATQLMQIAISMGESKEKAITAHVRDYNIASNHLFQKLGFQAIQPGINTLYVLRTKQYKPGK